FILLAGVVGISVARLATAIAIGRGVRYVALGILAVKYGERAMNYMRENGTTVSLAVVGLLAAGFVVCVMWMKSRAAWACREDAIMHRSFGNRVIGLSDTSSNYQITR